jgi:hypothetical protein
MKRFGLFVVAGLVFGLAGAVPSNAGSINLVTNGAFNTSPALSPGGWGLYTNGQVAGWTTTDSGGQIEIDTVGAIGPGSDQYLAGGETQTLEVNANNPEDVQQTITGLTVGQTYVLSWDYGDRPGSGPESMQVWLNGVLVTVNSDNRNNSVLEWNGNDFVITATSTSELLSFDGLADSGIASYGNEVAAVSLIATPEPATWLLMLSGIGLLGFALWRQRGVTLPGTSTI